MYSFFRRRSENFERTLSKLDGLHLMLTFLPSADQVAGKRFEWNEILSAAKENARL
jgi:hypothetical protein